METQADKLRIWLAIYLRHVGGNKAELARRVGLPYTSVVRILNETRPGNLPGSSYQRMAEKIGISVPQLLWCIEHRQLPTPSDFNQRSF